jgi:hypothetical protein
MNEKTIRLSIPEISIEREKLVELYQKYFYHKDIKENLMNYDKTCSIELKDMGNDIETWFVTEISNENVIKIGNYNYRSNPSFIDYSLKYKIFFYIFSSWSYKGGSHYYLHIHYKDNFYESYISHDNYTRLSISHCGENLIISIKDLGICEIELKDLIESLEKNTTLTKGQYFIDEVEFRKRLERTRENDEAKMAYRTNYPDEYGDD